MRSRSFRGLLAPLASLGLLLAGCSGGGTDSPSDGPASQGRTSASAGTGPRLIFITNSNSDWWNAVEKGMQDAGAEFGCQVEMRRNDGSTQGQIDKLRDCLSLEGVKGVAVSALESDTPGIIDAMKELQNAGIQVLAIDSDVAPEHADARRAYIGTNNLKAGEIAGKAAAMVRPEGGKTAVFVGTAAAANARARADGFFAGAGEKFSKESVWEDQNDFAKNQQNVQNAITKAPDLGVVLALWSYNGPIVAEVIASSPEIRAKTSVVTFDLAEAAVEHLEKGNIDVSVCQNPYDIGHKGVQLLKAFVEDDTSTINQILPDGKSFDTGVRVIVPKAGGPVQGLDAEIMTVEEMKNWLESKGLKSS
jgi:ribose transport system substrate-binding protein